MKRNTIAIAVSERSSDYTIVIGDDLLPGCGRWARKCLGKDTQTIALISNATVHKLYGRQIEESLLGAGFHISAFLIGDGERFKSLRVAESALSFLSANRISRTDAVVALGGGVVGDLAGFVSAIYLRGISFLQVPTTLLAMIDSSVGGKTGVNSAFGKNLLGAFHQPRGVLIDTAVLETLPARELTAGFCEAVKQGAIGGRSLFGQTADFLSHYRPRDLVPFAEDPDYKRQISNLISEQVAFKAKIVAADERESSNRTDSRSRKILNFGHTLAHALEKITDYKYLRHGEAVGYGIIFAAELSKSLALITGKDVDLLNDVVHRAGKLPRLDNIDPQKVIEAFRFDKKNVAGSLQMVLLKGIGKPVILQATEIPSQQVKKVLKQLLSKWA